MAAARAARSPWPGSGPFRPWSSQVIALQAATVAAWGWYAVLALQSTGRPQAHGPVWWCMPGMTLAPHSGGLTSGSVATGLPVWLVMSTAMTVPAVLPAAQHVATNTFRRQRSRAVGVFTATYLAVWLSFVAAVVVLLAPLQTASPYPLFASALAIAAAYEMTPLKLRALNRCHRSSPLPPSGARAVAGVARFGWINASGCVASCWAAMLAMLLAPGGQLLVTVTLTAAMSYERLTRRPRRGRRRVAAAYATVAIAIVLVAI
jgi:predicted metal-binding membrane protein